MFSIIIFYKNRIVKIKLLLSFLKHAHQHAFKIYFNINNSLTQFNIYLILRELLN